MFPLIGEAGVPSPNLLSLGSVQSLLDSLPAEARARIRWTPQAVRLLLRPLEEAPGPAELDAIEWQLAVGLGDLSAELARDLVQVLDGEAASLVGTMVRHLPDLLATLRSAAAGRMDLDAWLALEWSVGVLTDASLQLSNLLAVQPPEVQQAVLRVGEPERDALAEDPETRAYLLAALYVAAATSALEGEIRIDDLSLGFVARRAYLAAARVADGLARMGIAVEPFRGASPEQRAQRFRDLTRALADALDDEAVAALDRARLDPRLFSDPGEP